MKTIADKLREKPPRKGSKKLQFLALKEQIKQALKQGYSIAGIWELLKEDNQLELSYNNFVLYVHKYIGKPEIQIDKEIATKSNSESFKKEEPKKFYHPPIPPSDEDLF